MTSDTEEWHLSPRVTLAVIGWIVAASLGGLAWAFSVSAELAVHRALISNIREENIRQDLASAEAMRLLREELKELRAEFRLVRETLQSIVKRG